MKGHEIMLALGFREVNEYGYPISPEWADFIGHDTVLDLMKRDEQDLPRLILELDNPETPAWAKQIVNLSPVLHDGWFLKLFLSKRLEMYA